MSYFRKTISLLLIASVIIGNTAAAGGVEDPVISQSYLESVFSGTILQEIYIETDEKINQLEAVILQQVEQQLAAARMSAGTVEGSSADGSDSLYMARKDEIIVAMGTKITPTEGDIYASSAGWIDVTLGKVIDSGAVMAIGHTYISTEEHCRLISNAAVGSVIYRGSYTLQRSGSTDYASRAQALSALGLFKGGTTGFELTRVATRAEALVMFLRILGLENEAQMTTAGNPFEDVPAWAACYAAYAYDQGLVQGRGTGIYDADTQVTVQDYLTFLLRSLGYREGTDFQWATALDDAVKLGLLNTSESFFLLQGSFTRAQMVYLSWQVLMTSNINGQLLICQLRDEGIVSRTQVAEAIQTICGARIS